MKYVCRFFNALDDFVADWWPMLMVLVFFAGAYWADSWWIDQLESRF